MFLLHTHTDAHGTSGIIAFLREVLLDGLLDTLKLLPFLFLTYLLMEYIEHKAEDRAQRFMSRAGSLAPLVGGALGVLPQCGFSAAASGLFAGRVISVGTLIAVFLSTSDEMLPILVGGSVRVGKIAFIILYKALVGIAVGFAVDLVIRLTRGKGEKINIDAICDEDNCHCERGILHSALHHTLTVSLFVLAVTVAIGSLVFFIGEENLSAVMHAVPGVSHILAAIFGLVPNCASSVILTQLCAEGVISSGTMMSGLFSGAGVGLIVLFRMNKNMRQNLLIVATLVLTGFVFGLLADLAFPTLVSIA